MLLFFPKNFHSYFLSTTLQRFKSTKYKTSKIVECDPKSLYNIVIDVDHYKDFVPLCNHSRIISRISEKEFMGELTINFKIYQESYISRVIHEKINNQYTIISISKNNPMFNSLISRWIIDEVDNNNNNNDKNSYCNVNYSLEYEFSSFIYQQMSSMLLNAIGKNTLDAFIQRALRLKSIGIEPAKNPLPGVKTTLATNTTTTATTNNNTDTLNQDQLYEKAITKKKVTLGPLSIMMKPRTKPSTEGDAHKLKVDELVLSKLGELKNNKILNDEEFLKLSEQYMHCKPTKEGIKDLYMLNKSDIINDSIFSNKVKEFIK